MTGAWDRLAAAVDYPEPGFAGTLRACGDALADTSPEAAASVRAFREAVCDLPLERAQELYIESFDFDPQCSLDLGWHVFGDSYERGEMLAALRGDLDRAGVRQTAELPDHLTHLLMLLAREDRARGVELAALMLPAVGRVEEALRRRQSPYAHLLRAVQAVLAAHVREAERTAP